MTAARKLNLVMVDDYLAGELVSLVKHEYLGGTIYAMAGATNVHNLIASNTLIALGARLRGKKCRAFNSDTKVRVRFPNQTRFYYPDVSVVCQPNPPEDSFHDNPVVVVEVLSPSTRRTDEGEKRDAYFMIGSLSVLLLVEPGSPRVLVHRRQEQGFVAEVYDGLEATVSLPEIGIDLALSELYEAVTFTSESEAADDFR